MTQLLTSTASNLERCRCWKPLLTGEPEPTRVLVSGSGSSAAAAPRQGCVHAHLYPLTACLGRRQTQCVLDLVTPGVLHNHCGCRYAATYGVRLDPSSQALSLIGSQEGLAHLLMAVADPGDGILMLDVAYPSYFGAVQIAGLVPTYIPCDRETWLPDWSQVPPAVAQRCTCLLLNYPNNPTGVVVGQVFWREVLQFCEQHELLLIHDNPYQSQVGGNGTHGGK